MLVACDNQALLHVDHSPENTTLFPEPLCLQSAVTKECATFAENP